MGCSPGTVKSHVSRRVVGFWGSDSSSMISSFPASAPQMVVNIGGSWLRGAKVVELQIVLGYDAAGHVVWQKSLRAS
jgi:hypothetical protein